MSRVIQTLIVSFLLITTGSALAQKTAGESVDDSWIHTKVKSALVGFGTSDINIEVYHGVVQLSGFVDEETKREAAGQEAAGVKGVVKVSNQMVTQTSSRSAGQLFDDGVTAGRVKSALAGDKRTSAFDINVEVRNDVVLLTGFVATAEEGELATEVAGNTENVEQVINGTDVRPAK